MPQPASPQRTVPDIVWQTARDRLIVSPEAGGRVLSWKHDGSDELVKQQLEVLDGGLMRVLLRQERYPGTSYVTPHLVVAKDADAMSVRMRFFWNTPNAFARVLGAPEKTNPCYVDGLLLDKTVRFDAENAALITELSVTNVTGEVRQVSPWLHSHFHGWVDHGFVVQDGKETPYLWHDVYWDGHRVGEAESMRLVAADARGQQFAVLGAATEGLTGMALYGRDIFGDKATEACMELRFKSFELKPGERWTANAFLVISDERARWHSHSPIELYSRIEKSPAFEWDESELWPLLQTWALPEERRRGLMVVSHLDKVPFTAAERYQAANAFAGFHAEEGVARATVSLYATRDLHGLCAKLNAPAGWSLSPLPDHLASGKVIRFTLSAPLSLMGKESVEVCLSDDRESELALLNVPGDAAVEPRYAYQIKQVSTYLEERFNDERSGYFIANRGKTPTGEGFLAWQQDALRRANQWARDAIGKTAPRASRLMERQAGPYCIRDKVLIQTEAGVWLPTYLIYPKDRPADKKMPGIVFAHGSGPGKRHFAPDETIEMQDPAIIGDWPSPYQFAHQLGCMVLLPDRRGWGEWGEGNHSQQPQRANAAGFNVLAMEVWDHLRAIDFLCDHPEVDARCVTSMGSSGGGLMTLFSFFNPRCAGGIVSSSITLSASIPDQYFHRSPRADDAPLHPAPHLPMATASMCTLAAPRPLWVMDGRWDTGVLPTLPHSDAEAKTAWAHWHAKTDIGRAEVAQAYNLLGEPEKYQATWFEGGHLAGFTLDNIAAWLDRYWGVKRRS